MKARWANTVATVGTVLHVTAGALAAQTVDFAVPESPGFTFLGVNPTKVTNPGTVRDLGASLLSAVDSNGNVVQGFALDFSVMQLGLPLTTAHVQADGLEGFFFRALSSLQVSVATARPAVDTASTDVGFGFRVTLFDGGEPWFDSRFTTELGNVILNCAPSMPGAAAAAAAQELACLAAGRQTVLDGWLDDNARAPRLSLGFGTGFRAVQSELKRRSSLGSSWWLVGELPLDRFQVLSQLQYVNRPAIGMTPSRESWALGGRVVYGGTSLKGFAEASGLWLVTAPNTVDASTGDWSAGIEFRIANHGWVATGLGSKFADSLSSADRVVVILGIRFAVNPNPRFN